MGIRFNCPNGHKLNVKEFLAGKRGVCPQCGAKFIIPTPAEGVPAEAAQPVGIGVSQSVEIAVLPPPDRPIASAPSSPSVIIPVTEVELMPLEVAPPPPVVTALDIQALDALPASIVAVQSPSAVAPDAAVPSQRQRSRRNQILISLLLLGLVVLLAAVLVWVLKREANQTPVEKKAASAYGQFDQLFAMSSDDLLITAHSRVGALDQ
jgi:hypothetical protein